jgi:HlyD family secretion protein
MKVVAAILGLRMTRGRLLIAALLILVALVAFQLIAGNRRVAVTSGTVTRGPVEQIIAATGRLEPLRVISVGAETSGQIANVYVDVGSRVHRGQTIAEVDPSRAEAAYRQGEAQVAVAEAALRQARSAIQRLEAQAADTKRVRARAQTLHQQGVLAERGVEMAEVAVRAAEADFEGALAAEAVRRAELNRSRAALFEARTTLARSRIVSPIDGVVVRRVAEPGQTLASTFQAPILFEIADDPSKLRLVLDVHESDVGVVAPGQVTRFRVQALPERTFKGVIARVAPQGRTVEGAVIFSVIVDVANPDGALRPAMTVEADVVVKHQNNALLVPAQALGYTPDAAPLQGMPYVKSIVIRPPGSGGARVERTRKGDTDGGERRVWRLDPSVPRGLVAVPITTGIEGDGRVQVLSGDLKEGERVAIAAKKR